MGTTHATEPTASERRASAGTTERRSTQRRKLWELEEHFHCSVIGTCLTLNELRHACRKAQISLHSSPTDHEFVNIAGEAVLCPLDCISHSAVKRIKHFCKRHQKTLVLLPRSSLAAFSRGLTEVVA